MALIFLQLLREYSFCLEYWGKYPATVVYSITKDTTPLFAQCDNLPVENKTGQSLDLVLTFDVSQTASYEITFVRPSIRPPVRH